MEATENLQKIIALFKLNKPQITLKVTAQSAKYLHTCRYLNDLF